MNAVVRVVSALVVPMVLALLVVFLGGSVDELKNPSVLSALFACAVFSHFLSSWFKAWVPPVLYIVFGALTYVLASIFQMPQVGIYLVGGVYGLWGVSLVMCAKDRLCIRGVGTIACPAVVVLLLLLILEVAQIVFVAGGSAGANLAYLGSSVAAGLIAALAIRFALPESVRGKLASVFMNASISVTTPVKKPAAATGAAPVVQTPAEPAAFPVGVTPTQSVLDAKLTARESGQGGAGTSAKMLAETDWD